LQNFQSKSRTTENSRNSIDTLVCEIMQFIEYIEDIEMGMQLSRRFNSK